MEKQVTEMEITTTSKSKECTNGQWSNEEKKRLVAVTRPLFEMQKAYGRKMEMKIVLRGWEALLASRYSVDQVIWALEQYALTRDDFPSPANVNQILTPPEEPKITEAEFVAAQKDFEKNGYLRFTQEWYTIQKYRAQNERKRDEWKTESDQIKQILGNSVKMIEKY